MRPTDFLAVTCAVDPKPSELSKADRAALKAFLESLTGTATFTGPPSGLPK